VIKPFITREDIRQGSFSLLFFFFLFGEERKIHFTKGVKENGTNKEIMEGKKGRLSSALGLSKI